MGNYYVGQDTSIGFGKEGTFGTAVVPSYFPAYETWSPNGKNTPIKRANARRRRGQSYMATGQYDFSASLRPGAEPDVLFFLLACAFGAQTIPTLVASPASTVAYNSTLSFGATIPSFTTQFYRVGDAIDFSGCMIDTLKLACGPGQELQADFGIVGQTEAINVAPTVPSYSSVFPLISEATGGQIGINGTLLTGPNSPVIKNWSVSLNNNLDKSLRTVGSRFVQGFPLGQRMVSGSLTLSFASSAQYKLFYGALTATSPQPSITPATVGITVASQSYADPATGKLIPYSLNLNMNAVYITSDLVPGKLQGQLEQTFAFEAAESAGNDDLSCVITNASGSIY